MFSVPPGSAFRNTPMNSQIRRFTWLVTIATPLVAVLLLQGCESPLAPRFPEPIEEPDTITNDDEGATGRRTIGRLVVTKSDSVRRTILVPCSAVAVCR